MRINGRGSRNLRTRRAFRVEILKDCIFGGVSGVVFLIIMLVGGLIISLLYLNLLKWFVDLLLIKS